jgi:hypothetical protein
VESCPSEPPPLSDAVPLEAGDEKESCDELPLAPLHSEAPMGQARYVFMVRSRNVRTPNSAGHKRQYSTVLEK